MNIPVLLTTKNSCFENYATAMKNRFDSITHLSKMRSHNLQPKIICHAR